MNYNEARELLLEKGQGHLLRYYDELSKEEQESLLTQIERIDFSVLSELDKKNSGTNERGHIEPLGALTIPEID